MNKNKLRVIYIMGCGRSGTTILDILLGNHAGFQSVGELNNAPQAWDNDEICSCGVRLKECDVWRNVGKFCFQNDQDNLHFNILKHQKEIERQVSIVKHMLGYYDKSVIRAYQSYVYDTFQLLGKETSASTIIDSSKSIGRGLALLSNTMLDVRIIHLVRDPRGVYFSFQKKNIVTPTRSVLSLSLYWNSVNLLASLLKLKYGENRFLRIRYEDLVTNSDCVMHLIENFIDTDLSDVKQQLRDEIPMSRGHLASGNRIRGQKTILKLRPDFKWKKQLGLRQRMLIEMSCFPLMLAYNYFGKDSPQGD